MASLVLPRFELPVVDDQGRMSREWYKFLAQLVSAVGPSLTSTDDIQIQDILTSLPIPLSSQNVGLQLNPRTDAEWAAGVTPIHYQYAAGNFKRYGATGNGATDDASAFSVAVSVGGTVEIPSGSYLLNSTVSITKNGVFLNGDSSDAVIIINGQTNAPAIQFGTGGATVFGGGAAGMVFTGRYGIIGVSGQAGLSCNSTGQQYFSDIFASSAVGSPLFINLSFANVSQTTLYDSQLQQAIFCNALFKNCVDIYATNCRFDSGALDGVQFDTSQGIYFAACTAYNNSRYGWNINSANPATGVNINCWFTDCIGDTSGQNNWIIGDLEHGFFSSCWGSSQISTALQTSSVGFFLDSGFVKDVQFIGGAAINNNSHGIQLDDTGGGGPSNIRFCGFSFGSIANSANGNGRSGAGYGLTISGSCSDIRIDGNCAFQGNATGPYSAGTGSDVLFTGSPIGYTTINGGNVILADGGTITHGLVAAPSRVSLTGTNSSQFVTIGTINSTTIAVQIKTSSGSGGSSEQIYWTAQV